MALPQDHISMALFCDFENVALGVRDANYDKFDIKRVLERLLLKGSIVLKKAYCDWDRYKAFKAPMHEANFELIEIPHVRQSGKNSADIRLVVDALDLCYTKSHVNTFVIISGDSDFSPLVSKLRENAKHVIGVGVKQSTSDLLIANCDEFIFYDDLVRESQRQGGRRDARESQAPQARRSPEEERQRREVMDARRAKCVDMAFETYEALVTDRDDGGKIWASVLKEAIKRRNPGFSESYYGFKTFGNLLEEAQARGLLAFGRDEKSGAYVYRGDGLPTGQGSGAARGEARSDLRHDTRHDVRDDHDSAQDHGEDDNEAKLDQAPVPGDISHESAWTEPSQQPRREGRSRGGQSRRGQGGGAPEGSGKGRQHRQRAERSGARPAPTPPPADAPQAPMPGPAEPTPASSSKNASPPPAVEAAVAPTSAPEPVVPKAPRAAAKKAARKSSSRTTSAASTALPTEAPPAPPPDAATPAAPRTGRASRGGPRRSPKATSGDDQS